MQRLLTLGLLIVVSCGGGGDGGNDGNGGGGDGALDDGAVVDDGDAIIDGPPSDCQLPTCSGGTGPTIGPCPSLPADHLFNTRIDTLPVHANSAAFIATIGGATNLHLDLGTQTNQQANDFYGIPYNLVDGSTFTWPSVAFASTDPDMSWNPRPESDCAVGVNHTFTQPCTAAAAPTPLIPIPASPIVEGGINTAANHLPYGDHHILVVDTSTCRLWETYHSYFTGGTWNIFGSAAFDLRSNALRPVDWTSADAAASRSSRCSSAPTRRRPARSATRSASRSSRTRSGSATCGRRDTSPRTAPPPPNLPPMGQLFRLKASYVIPPSYTTQAKAILQAMKTYGMYLADGGSDMYVQGDPSASWTSTTISQVQSVEASSFEAVDLAPIMARTGWSVNSGRVPPP